MLSKYLENSMNYLFKRILSLNKSQFTSLPFTGLLLLMRCIFGTFFVMSIFFADSTAFYNITQTIKNTFIINQSTNDMQSSTIIAILFTLSNLIITILFLNCFKKQENQIIDKLLLTILTLSTSFKYFIIVILCSQIRSQIVNGNVIFTIINSLNLLINIFWNFVFDNFYFTLNYSTKNLLARFNFQFNIYTQTFLILVTIIFTFIGSEQLSSVMKLIFNFIFLFVKILYIYVGLLKSLYVNKNVQQIHSFLLMIQMVTLLANIVIQLTNQHLLKTNFFLCIFITGSFCFLGWKAYFDWNRQDIYFTKGIDIKNSSKALIYLKAIHDIISKVEQNQNNSLILASIKKQHEFQCKNLTCYCRVQGQNNFMRQYSMQQLQILRNTFKNCPKILIQELNLRFYMFNSYPEILNRLELIKTHFTLSLTEQYSLLTLKSEVIRLIDQKNLAGHTIDVESPLRLQQVSNKLQNIIKKDIQKKTKKWKYLSRGMCRIEQLQQDTNLQIHYLKQITKINVQQMVHFRRSIIFNLLLMFYYRKISFLNVRTQQIQKNLNDQLKKIKEEQLFSTKQFSKWIFHKRSCVVESLIDDQNIGLVTRSSKNVYEMFGYHQSKVIGMNLNKLMPNFMSVQHDNIIRDWINTGTWRTVGRLKQIFCIHKDESCFTALIYLKVIANEKGLFFIGVVFKKNESDYLVLNAKQQVEGVGRKFMYLIGQNCRKLPIQVLCNDFPTLDMTKQQDYKYFVKEFRSLNSNETLAEQFMEQKNRRYLSDEQEKKFINEYQKKIQSQNIQKWEVKFGIKVFRMRELVFYVVVLNSAKKIQNSSKSQLDTQRLEVIIGTGKINEDQQFDIDSQNEPSDLSLGQKQAQFYEQKNSSMISYAQRQSFTLTKLLKYFYDFLIRPEQIKNKRINTLNISTLLQTLILTSIISISFVIYINSLNEIKSYVSANAEINQRMQLAILMYNKVISISEYQKDTVTLNKFLVMTSSDLDQFYATLAQHVQSINKATSEFHNQQLYKYLKSPVNYIYQRKKTRQVQVLQFLEYYYYMTSKIKQDVISNNSLDVLVAREYQLDRIKQNFPELKSISSNICSIFKQMIQKTKNYLVIVAWIVMVVFFIVTFIFFLYTYNYFCFRFEQKHQCLQIYKIIPPNLIDRTKQYYVSFYTQLFSTGGNKSVGIQNDLQNLNKNQLIVQDNSNNMMHNNKIKFIGKQRFTGWIRSLIMFFAINTINILITYEIVTFVQPLSSFMNDINNIMDSQNKQLESYLDIKGAYLLSHKPKINETVVNSILVYMNQNQVTFNQMVMFESPTLSLYDSSFYGDFYKILVDNVCLQIKDMLDDKEYADCMALSKGGLIQDGVITYMNYFQRKLRSVLEDLKVNSTARFTTQGRNYFMNRGFRQIDLAMSYNIKIFRKLIERILQGYMKGIDYISFINIIVLILLITPQVTSLVLWFHLVKQQKQKLSLLYGSMLMIPPNVVRHVKNLPRMAKKILQFSQN